MNDFEQKGYFNLLENLTPDYLNNILEHYKEKNKDFNIEILLKLYDVEAKYNIAHAMFSIAEQLHDISLSIDDIKSTIDNISYINNISKNNF